MMCLKNKYFSLQGDYYSEIFKYVEIRLYRCVNSTKSNVTCKSEKEIQDYFRYGQLSLILINSYFDFSVYEYRDLNETIPSQEID